MRKGILRALAAACGVMAGTGHLVGCAVAPSAGPAPGYVASYQAGRYADAYSGAVKAATEGTTQAERDRGSLFAGQSAHAMSRMDDAERWLRPALESRDRQISGRAAATLGLIAQERKLHARAAEHLTTAADRLTGDEAARAALYAGDSLRAQGRHAEAQAMYERAKGLVQSDAAVRRLIADRTGMPSSGGAIATTPGGAFAVQAGVFSTRSRAEAEASRLAPTAQRLGLGGPAIVGVEKGGRSLYAVRVGRFSSKQAAEQARRSLGSEAIVVGVTDAG